MDNLKNNMPDEYVFSHLSKEEVSVILEAEDKINAMGNKELYLIAYNKVNEE